MSRHGRLVAPKRDFDRSRPTTVAVGILTASLVTSDVRPTSACRAKQRLISICATMMVVEDGMGTGSLILLLLP